MSLFVKICFWIVAIVAINVGLTAVFNYDIVAQIFGVSLFGGWTASRIVYTIVGIAGVVVVLDALGLIKKA